MKLPESSRLITILIWSGVAALVLSVALGITLLTSGLKGLERGDFRHWLEGVLDASSVDTGLGGEGTVCGGAGRLPCNPGLWCSARTEDGAWTGEEGVCEKDTRETTAPGREGEICSSVRGCVPGLVCNRVGRANGVCIRPQGN